MALLVWSLSGQLPAAEDDIMVRVRVDPVVSLVGGASVSVDVAREDDDWRLTATAFVVDVPRPLVPFVVDGPDTLKITESVLQLGAMWSASAGHTGFFIGPELFLYRLSTVDEARPSHIAMSYEAYAHVTGGWVLFPWRDGIPSMFFVQPLVTVGVPIFGSGDAVFFDGDVVADRVFNWHATISVGVELW